MTITRVIHGEEISIELTEDELCQAQQVHVKDARRITGRIFCIESSPGAEERH